MFLKAHSGEWFHLAYLPLAKWVRLYGCSRTGVAESSAFSSIREAQLGREEQDFLPHCPSVTWAAMCITDGRGRQEAEEQCKTWPGH